MDKYFEDILRYIKACKETLGNNKKDPEPEPQIPHAVLVAQKSSASSENTAVLTALCKLFKKEDGTLFYKPIMLQFMNQTELYSDEWITDYNSKKGETFPTTFSEEDFAIFWQAVEANNYTENIKIKYI